MCEIPGKALIYGENHEIEKSTHRLRHFDIRRTALLEKKNGNINRFILFGSGHFNAPEVRGKSSSVTTHRIPGNVNAIVWDFAITTS